jgi:cyanate permease
MLRYLPESTSFLEAKAAVADGAGNVPVSAGKRAVGVLFRSGMLRSTLAFWVTSFMGLLLVYGLNTWLPEIMRQAGYPLGAALALLLTLNVGGPIRRRRGPRPWARSQALAGSVRFAAHSWAAGCSAQA